MRHAKHSFSCILSVSAKFKSKNWMHCNWIIFIYIQKTWLFDYCIPVESNNHKVDYVLIWSWSCVATVVFNIRLLHAVAFSKKLPCFEPTNVINLKTQLHTVNARWKRLWQHSLMYVVSDWTDQNWTTLRLCFGYDTRSRTPFTITFGKKISFR